MIFQILYDKQPVKFIKKLSKDISTRLIDKINELSNNCVPHNAKTVVGKHGVFRIRIGDYRALYRVNYENKTIIIFKVDKRPRVYD